MQSWRMKDWKLQKKKRMMSDCCTLGAIVPVIDPNNPKLFFYHLYPPLPVLDLHVYII